MLKVGLCGAGFMGTMHAACYASLKDVKVTAVADKRPAFGKKLAAQYGAKLYRTAAELIADAEVDIVDVCLPTPLHAETAILALKRGRNCLCEKPMARTPAEAAQMMKAVRAAKGKFMVAQVIRFWPEYQVLKEYVDKKPLGKLVALTLSRVSPLPNWGWKDWLNQPAMSGGATLDMHVHDMDYVRYLLGEPAVVKAVGPATPNKMNAVYAVLSYPRANVVVNCEGLWTTGDQFEMAFRAVFEKGTLKYSSRFEPLTCYRPGREPEKIAVAQPKTTNVAAGGNLSSLGGYFNEIQYFVECVKKNRQPTIASGKEAAASLGLIFREIASSREA